MEYDPKQLEILIHNVAFTLGSNLEGLLFQQKNILDNQLNNLMIDHNGQAESITPDEIVGAFEIATIHKSRNNISYLIIFFPIPYFTVFPFAFVFTVYKSSITFVVC